MLIKLKKCPFCGHSIESFRIETDHNKVSLLEIECRYCNMEISFRPGYVVGQTFDGFEEHYYEDDPVRRWNMRDGKEDEDYGSASC